MLMQRRPFDWVPARGNAVNPSMGAPGAASMPRTVPQTGTQPNALSSAVSRHVQVSEIGGYQPLAASETGAAIKWLMSARG